MSMDRPPFECVECSSLDNLPVVCENCYTTILTYTDELNARITEIDENIDRLYRTTFESAKRGCPHGPDEAAPSKTKTSSTEGS